jgi:thioredoxin 1
LFRIFKLSCGDSTGIKSVIANQDRHKIHSISYGPQFHLTGKGEIMTLKHLDDSNFKDGITTDKPVIVDFYADWCGPCKMLAPIFEELATEMDGKAVFCKVNIDKAMATAQQYGVMSIPTIIFFKNGEKVEQTVGFVGKEILKTKIEGLG